MFRPCIDLHEGKVKQLVGGTLGDTSPRGLRTNFVSDRPAAWFAELYRRDGLEGGHIIMLGAGNEAEARTALAAYPGGMQVGGGINLENASAWLDAGASHVIVTSYIFREGRIDSPRLKALVAAIGRDKLVLDLSCRKRGDRYYVVTDRWTKFTETEVGPESLRVLAGSCAEFLIHAVDVEGLCAGIERKLISLLAENHVLPMTYAGGVTSLADVKEVVELGRGLIDVTVGSALDIFGGHGVRYEDLVAFNREVAR